MIMEKLLSKRGQISMEIGILVAAAVAVAAVAAYFYIQSVRQSAQNVGGTANQTIGTMANRTQEISQEIGNILGDVVNKKNST